MDTVGRGREQKAPPPPRLAFLGLLEGAQHCSLHDVVYKMKTHMSQYCLLKSRGKIKEEEATY